jgi:hypothetical protein
MIDVLAGDCRTVLLAMALRTNGISTAGTGVYECRLAARG